MIAEGRELQATIRRILNADLDVDSKFFAIMGAIERERPGEAHQAGNSIEAADELLDMGAVAKLLGVTPSRVAQLVRESKLGGIIRIGRRVRFSRRGLEGWLAGGGAVARVEVEAETHVSHGARRVHRRARR